MALWSWLHWPLSWFGATTVSPLISGFSRASWHKPIGAKSRSARLHLCGVRLPQRPLGSTSEAPLIGWAIFPARDADHRLYGRGSHRPRCRSGSPLPGGKKTGLPLSSQFAVYVVERLLDAGSMALIFSCAMLTVPYSEIMKATSHSHIISALGAHSPFLAAFAARYGGLVLTLLGALFLAAVRWAGGTVPSAAERSFGLFSKKLGVAAGGGFALFMPGSTRCARLASSPWWPRYPSPCGCSSPRPTSQAAMRFLPVQSWPRLLLQNAFSSWWPAAGPAFSNFLFSAGLLRSGSWLRPSLVSSAPSLRRPLPAPPSCF